MVKIVRVSDEIHERLKVHADADRRTINGEAEIILEMYFGEAEGGLTSEQVTKNRMAEALEVKEHIVNEGRQLGILPNQLELVPLSDLDPPAKNLAEQSFASQKIENTQTPQTPRELYDLAKRMTEELEEELKYNQDPESRSRQEKVGKAQIQLVWDEYHELKSSEE